MVVSAHASYSVASRASSDDILEGSRSYRCSSKIAAGGCGAAALSARNGVLLPDGEAEDMLKQEIAVRLGLAPAREGAE